jgi:hypothetical protein
MMAVLLLVSAFILAVMAAAAFEVAGEAVARRKDALPIHYQRWADLCVNIKAARGLGILFFLATLVCVVAATRT